MGDQKSCLTHTNRTGFKYLIQYIRREMEYFYKQYPNW